MVSPLYGMVGSDEFGVLRRVPRQAPSTPTGSSTTSAA